MAFLQLLARDDAGARTSLLQAQLTEGVDTRTRYLAQLFLGWMHERAGRRDEALGAFRAALVAEFLRVGHELVADQPAQLLLARQQGDDAVPLGGQRCLLFADLHLLEPGEVPELGLQDRLGLRGVGDEPHGAGRDAG